MKLFRSLFFSSLLLVAGTACERHPASQTIPGYKEKNHSLGETKALIPSAHPSRFFHAEKSEAPAAGE